MQPWIEPLRELLDDGTIQPVVAGAFSFEHAGEGHRMLSERRNVGKVVLDSLTLLAAPAAGANLGSSMSRKRLFDFSSLPPRGE